jgi:Bacterial Ig domain
MTLSRAALAALIILAPAAPALAAPTVQVYGVSSGQTVSGSLPIEARAGGGTIRRVEFRLDGALLKTESYGPYCLAGDGGALPCYAWDSRRVADGSHTLRATAYDSTGASGSASVTFTVRNVAPQPSPTPSPSGVRVSILGVTSGQVASGNLPLEARASGGTIARVEFRLDGVLVKTERYGPYCLAGDGGRLPCLSWDSRGVADGAHTLRATAYTTSGASGSAQVGFTVRNATPSPSPSPSIPVARSILEWTSAPTGTPAASFRVYVAPAGGSFSPVAETGDTSVPLSGLGLVAGRDYRARVTALSTNRLESAPSAELLFRYQP